MDGEALVTRWIEAFNAQDLEEMLSCVSSDVAFQPLELLGLHTSYTGHLGVRRWFTDFEPFGRDHRLAITNVSRATDGQIVAVGSLTLGRSKTVASFCGLHRISKGEIVMLRHYFSDAETVRRLGLVA